MSRPYRPESASSSVVHAPKRGSFCVLTWGGLREGRFPSLFQICALVSPCSRCISTTNFRPPKGLIVVFVAAVRGRGLPNINRVVIRRPHSTPFFQSRPPNAPRARSNPKFRGARELRRPSKRSPEPLVEPNPQLYREISRTPEFAERATTRSGLVANRYRDDELLRNDKIPE